MPRTARRCSVRKLFARMDVNGDGELTLKEVVAAFNKAAGQSKTLTYKKMRRSCINHTRRKSNARN